MGTLTGSPHSIRIVMDKGLWQELGLRVLIPVLTHGSSFCHMQTDTPLLHPSDSVPVLVTHIDVELLL